MDSLHKLTLLYQGISALNELPIMKLAENGQLKNEIKEIVSSKNLASIVNDIANEHRMMSHNRAMNSQSSTGALNSKIDDILKKQEEYKINSERLLKSYSKYQTASYGVFNSDKRYKSLVTEPVTGDRLRAFNQNRYNPFHDDRIKKLKETRDFIEVFNSIRASNSIYSDLALKIGTTGDPTQISSYIDYSPYIYNYQYYLAIPTLAQTVDTPNNIATREMPDLIFEDNKLSDQLEKHLRRTRFNEKIKKMLLYSSLSPRGALIVPIVENGRVRFNVFNDTQFTYAATQQYSRIDYQDNTTGVSQIFCLGHILQNEVTAHFLCPGFEPIFAIGKNKVFQLKGAAEAINIYLYTIKVLCIRAQVMVQTWGGEGQTDTKLDQLRKLADTVSSRLSLNDVVKVPQGASLDILNNNLSEGFAKVSPIIKEFQGMLSGVMPDYFYGSDTAYNANAFNLNVTHQNIKSQIQEEQIEPVYRFCVNALLNHDDRFKQYRKEMDNFDVKFKSLYEPTQAEKASTTSLEIENLIKMSDYPELEDVFKKEGLLRDEHSFKKLNPSLEREDEDGDAKKTQEKQKIKITRQFQPGT